MSEVLKQDRRSFLLSLAAAGASGSLLAACARGVSVTTGSVTPSAKRIGLQMYTVRDLLAKDFDGTVEQVAKIGYTELEFAGYSTRTAEQVRALLDRLKVSSPSAHIGVPLLRQDLAAQIAIAKTIGQEFITVPSYPFPRDAGKQAFSDAAAELNKWGEQCRTAGLKLGYHNHAGELKDVGGMTGLDVMISETKPELVSFENDLYWTTFAGVDPLSLFAKYPGRFAMWHVKDMKDMQASKTMAPVGEGAIDFKRIFAQAKQSGMRHFFVEHDTAAQMPGGSLASVTTSFNTLRGMLS